jgi:DUF4097 and DUF4098 domain-containing protein YvlB
MKSKSSVAAAYLGLAACALSANAIASQAIDQRLPADARGAVQISMTSGRLILVGWDKPEVEITGSLAGDAERLDVEREGNTINIRVLKKEASVHWISETDLTVKIPLANGVGVAAVGADVKISGINGEQRVQTVSGNVEAEVAAADVEFKSLSGDLKIHGTGASPHSTLSTVSGGIKVREVGGEFDMDTVSGTVALDLGTVHRVKLKSISGDLTAGGRLDRDARIDVSSVSGDMHMRFLGSESADIIINSFSGDITPCFGNVAVIHPAHGPGVSWQYDPPNSSADIHAKSLSGDIVICNK